MIGGIENVTGFEEFIAQENLPEATSELGQDSFLKLLVAQMQHQDPLNPQSNGEFVAQLAQFTSLEQLMSVNNSLNNLYTATASMNNAAMTQLLDRYVTAISDKIPYGGEGSKEIFWDAATESEKLTVTITNEDGTMVARKEFNRGMPAGEGSWIWDGTDTFGAQCGEGEYTITVRAENVNGQEVFVQSLLKGTVTEMNYETGTPTPYVDGVKIAIGDILRVETSRGDEEVESSSGDEEEDAA